MDNPKFSTPPSWVANAEGLRESLLSQQQDAALSGGYVHLEDVGRFIQGVKQLFYWKRQLLPSISKSTIILAFLGKQGLAPVNVLEVCKALKSVCNMDNVIEIFKGAHTRFLGISFTTDDEVRKIIDHFHYFGDTVVSCVYSSTANFADFRLLWLPPLFQAEKIKNLLDSYFKSYTLFNERIQIDDDKFSNTNVVWGRAEFKAELPIDKLPHLVKLPSPHKGCALLVLEGRGAMCLKCRGLGHLRKQCKAVKCSNCKGFHALGDFCNINSYAYKVTNRILRDDTDDWLAHVSDEQNISSLPFNESIPKLRRDVSSFSNGAPLLLAPNKSYSKLTIPSKDRLYDPMLFVDSPTFNDTNFSEDESQPYVLEHGCTPHLPSRINSALAFNTDSKDFSHCVEDTFVPSYVAKPQMEQDEPDNAESPEASSSNFLTDKSESTSLADNNNLSTLVEKCDEIIVSSHGEDQAIKEMEDLTPATASCIKDKKRKSPSNNFSENAVKAMEAEGLTGGVSLHGDDDTSPPRPHKLHITEKNSIRGLDPPPDAN